MYDELVKRLREHNGWALNETLDEAADAIEELQRAVKLLESDRDAERILRLAADDVVLYDALKAFEDSRKILKMPMPPRAKELLVGKLVKEPRED